MCFCFTDARPAFPSRARHVVSACPWPPSGRGPARLEQSSEGGVSLSPPGSQPPAVPSPPPRRRAAQRAVPHALRHGMGGTAAPAAEAEGGAQCCLPCVGVGRGLPGPFSSESACVRIRVLSPRAEMAVKTAVDERGVRHPLTPAGGTGRGGEGANAAGPSGRWRALGGATACRGLRRREGDRAFGSFGRRVSEPVRPPC